MIPALAMARSNSRIRSSTSMVRGVRNALIPVWGHLPP